MQICIFFGGKGYHLDRLSNFCGFVSANIFFFDENICQFMFEKKNIYRFYTFQRVGGSAGPKIVKFHF